MTCYTYNGITYSEAQLIGLAIEKIDSDPQLINLAKAVYKLEKDPIEIIDGLMTVGEEAQREQRASNGQKYISATSFPSAKHYKNVRKDGQYEWFQFVPEYVAENRRGKYIEDHKDDPAFSGNIKAVEEAFEDMVSMEQWNSQVGTYVHNLVHALLTDPKKQNGGEYLQIVAKLESDLQNNKEFLRAITENSNISDPTKETAKIKKAIEQQAQNIVNWIQSEFNGSGKPGIKKIYSEMPMLLKNTPKTNLKCIDENGALRDYAGIIGVADLIVVDNNDNIHLVDYKVCTRQYNEWYEAKKYDVEYQLAIYRAILNEVGIDGDKINMIIKPIFLPKGDIFNIQEEPSADQGIRADNVNRISRIAWIGGVFTGNLRQLGIGNKPIYKPIELTGIKKDIEDDYSAIMGFKKDPKKITKEWFIENEKIVSDKDANGQIIGWKFWSTTAGTQGAWVRAKTKEELLADDGPLDEYIQELEVSRNSIAQTIIKEINDFKDPKKNITSFLHTDKNVQRRELLTSVLGKYISDEWRCLNGTELPDIFTEYGILLFGKQDRATGETIIDIVCLSAFDLDLRVPINNQGTILGKYHTDEEAMKLSITPMNSMYKHVKAIEAMSVLNTVLKSQPELFNNVHFNRFKVLNPSGQVTDNMSMNVDMLYDNFQLLCDKNHGNIDAPLLQVPKLKTYEQCMVDLQDVLNQSGVDENLKDILKDIDNGSVTLHAKKLKVMQLLQAMRNKYAKVRTVNGSNGNSMLDLNDPVIFCYIMLSQINNALHGIQVQFDGRTNEYGIGFDEILAFLGVTFLGKFKQVNNDGSLNSGLAGGAQLSSPSIVQSRTLQQISDFYSIVYGDTREKFLKESNFVVNLTKKYVSNFKNNLESYIQNDNVKIWERLLIHEADGSINPSLLFKNPYDNSNDLTELDREFLKQYLWEINKYRLDVPNLDRSWHYTNHKVEIDADDSIQSARSENDGLYFQLPLARSDSFQRIATLSDYGIGNWFQAKWKDFEETTDPRRLHNERIKQIKKDNDITEMYNNYKISQRERISLLENTNNPYDFSLDLDFLACDVAFQTIRKETFDEALMLTETVLVAMSLIEQQTGADMSTEKDFLINQKKINLTGEPIQNEEMQRMTKTIQIPREINSVLVLAFRPLQMIKELAYGMFVNFSRAWSLKFGSNALTLKNVTRASGVVWGQKVTHKVEVLTGSKDIADFTSSEAVNRLYGIANEDLNRFAKNTSMSRVGRVSNHSKWMYIAQSAPDYYNRMTLFIAKMMEDGCWEAHTLDENGNLIYDWKKDKRFDKLAKYGLNSDYKGDPEYNKQKALYASMCDEFEKGNQELKVWNKEKRRYEFGDITQAYTAKQRDSIKEVADVAYGFYDHETKSQFNHKFLGLFFLQFQTFLSAKFNLLFKAPTARGGNTKQGRFVEVVRNGETYYDVAKINQETGELIEVQSIPESQLTEEQKRDCQPSMEWQGDFSEGLVWSVLYTIHDIFTLNWKEVVNNKQRLAQVGLAMYDLLLGIILVNILKAIFSKGTNKMENMKPLQRVLTRSLEDVGPQAITQVSLTPSFFKTWSHLKSDGLKLFAGDNDIVKSLSKDFGATRDFIWEEV